LLPEFCLLGERRWAVKFICVLLLLIPGFVSAAEGKYCEPPVYQVRGRSLDIGKVIAPQALLNPEEVSDPEAGRKLASTPGPYGHSELGFRHLARLFGYPGKFGDKEKVEEWISLEEINNYQVKRGLRQIWQEWVVEGKKRLPVPTGAVAEIPANASAQIFFDDLADLTDHARCVGDALDKKYCENYVGQIWWSAEDRVSFGKPEKGKRVCAYYAGPVNRAKQENERKHQSEPTPRLNGAGGESGARGGQ
jgi:hypothetical protein